MMALEPIVYDVITLEAKSTYEVMTSLYTSETDIATKRGVVFKALCNLAERGEIVSKLIRTSTAANPSKYWALPGGTFPKGVDE